MNADDTDNNGFNILVFIRLNLLNPFNPRSKKTPPRHIIFNDYEVSVFSLIDSALGDAFVGQAEEQGPGSGTGGAMGHV